MFPLEFGIFVKLFQLHQKTYIHAHNLISTTYCECSGLISYPFGFRKYLLVIFFKSRNYFNYVYNLVILCSCEKNHLCSGGQLVAMEQGRGERTTQLHVWQSG